MDGVLSDKAPLTRSVVSPRPAEGSGRLSRLWWLPLILLLALRAPSIVQPAGGDQGLYGYAGQRILAGDVLYRDAWDQKPPGIGFTYALLWRVWPHESVVAAADFAAAAAVACLLLVLGRRRFSHGAGFGAAALFLLLGDPYLYRLGGMYVRSQCEPFIALAVTAGLVVLAGVGRERWRLVLAGVFLALAFWLKYNAATYALPLAVAAWTWKRDATHDYRKTLHDLAWVGAGLAAVSAGVLLYFIATNALLDLRLATIDYNLRYANETYQSVSSMLLYPLSFPIERARVDMLWFLGGLGSLLLLSHARSRPSALVTLAWVLAATLSIAVNGRRDLPNYFVQAAPALALAAAAGLDSALDRPRWLRCTVAAVLLAGVWRVGAEQPVWGLRFAGLPGILENVRYDLAHVRGHLDRATYLHRFRGEKHDALEIDELTRYVRRMTTPDEPIFVFGFSGGSVCWKSERVSSSRFFWSRPIIIGFEADRRGYGATGLLDDLRRRPPALVALQKDQWGSYEFFMRTDALRAWLETRYVADRDTPMFSVWIRK